MSAARAKHRRTLHHASLGLLVLAVLVAIGPAAHAQDNRDFLNTRAVGGVLIDPQGMLTNATVADMRGLRETLAEWSVEIPGDLKQAAQTRKISLRKLEETIRRCAAEDKPLPDEVVHLGGLQRIQYVLVYPEQGDIVLAGPGEGWRPDPRGVMVGKTTGKPVMLLDDLLTALRTAGAPQRRVISCSIDPTEEGLKRLSAHARTLRTIGNPEVTARGIEQQLGPQAITVEGVPETSHFARVMVTADYRMKRVSMGLEQAPVDGLPSFLGLMKATGRGMSNMLPRWWLAPDYEPLARDAEGLAWEIRGGSVKAMAENDFLDADGLKRGTRGADPASQRWADVMTERYDDLAKAEPVFGELRNCMDLAVAAALIVGEGLMDRAGASLPLLMGAEEGLEPLELNPPRQVASEASLVHKGRKWMIAAGGVEINPWEIVSRVDETASLSSVRRGSAVEDGDRWWSN